MKILLFTFFLGCSEIETNIQIDNFEGLYKAEFNYPNMNNRRDSKIYFNPDSTYSIYFENNVPWPPSNWFIRKDSIFLYHSLNNKNKTIFAAGKLSNENILVKKLVAKDDMTYWTMHIYHKISSEVDSLYYKKYVTGDSIISKQLNDILNKNH